MNVATARTAFASVVTSVVAVTALISAPAALAQAPTASPVSIGLHVTLGCHLAAGHAAHQLTNVKVALTPDPVKITNGHTCYFRTADGLPTDVGATTD